MNALLKLFFPDFEVYKWDCAEQKKKVKWHMLGITKGFYESNPASPTKDDFKAHWKAESSTKEVVFFLVIKENPVGEMVVLNYPAVLRLSESSSCCEEQESIRTKLITVWTLVTAVNGSPTSGGCICSFGVKAFKDEGDLQHISFFFSTSYQHTVQHSLFCKWRVISLLLCCIYFSMTVSRWILKKI